ncbi:MAG: hypothetical protein ACOYIF_11845 [Acetivibrionales bacterium]|jgi:hypothetical protein
MIELVIKNYLDSALSIPVSFEVPESPPSRFVVVEKTGSGKSDHIKSSTFAFQSYAESLYESAVLNELVKTAVEDLIQLDEIGNVRLNSDYNFTDTTTKQYRYQAVYDITHY